MTKHKHPAPVKTESSQELLEVLACPRCKGELTLKTGQMDGYGTLYCAVCSQNYAIKNGIADLLPPELSSLAAEQERDAPLSIKEANMEYGSVYRKENETHGYGSMVSDACLLPRGMDYILKHLGGTDSRILETCCATGTTASYLHAGGYKPVCFDISTESLIHLLERHPGICRPFIADAENMPIKSELFDAVIFNGAIHHLPSPRRALEESFRVLKSKGRVILVEPNSIDSEMMRAVFKSLAHPGSVLKNIKDTYNSVTAKVQGKNTMERDGIKYQKDGDGRWIRFDAMDLEISLPYLLRVARSVGFKILEANTWDIALVPFQQVKPSPSIAARRALNNVDAVLEKIPLAKKYGETMHIILEKP